MVLSSPSSRLDWGNFCFLSIRSEGRSSVRPAVFLDVGRLTPSVTILPEVDEASFVHRCTMSVCFQFWVLLPNVQAIIGFSSRWQSRALWRWWNIFLSFKLLIPNYKPIVTNRRRKERCVRRAAFCDGTQPFVSIVSSDFLCRLVNEWP